MVDEATLDGARVAPIEPTDTFSQAGSRPAPRHLTECLSHGFSVPEQDLNCAIRHWLHPSGSAGGGIVLVRGQVDNAAAANFIDYRHQAPIAEVKFDDLLFPGGVRLRVVEPLRTIELSYSSPDGRLSFRCRQTALMPPALERPSHAFTQPMAAMGELRLDGVPLRIDGYAVREHRWTAWEEAANAASPIGRGTAIFGPDLAIHFAARDGEALDGAALDRGYVWRGETRRLEAAWMRTGRGADGAAPAWVEVRLADSVGEIYELAGETTARAAINLAPDVIDQICLMEYRMNGRRCFGDFHDLQSNSFLRAARG